MEISTATNLPECSPNLMPFHISHSGSAPISVYFRVKPSPDSESSEHLSFTQKSPSGINLTRDDSQNTLVAEETQCSSSTAVESQSLSVEEDSQASADCGIQASSSTSVPQMIPREGSNLGGNFVAAFRGRQLHGRTVNLPHGYGGIVLNASLGGTNNEAGDTGAVEKTTQNKGKGRATRQTNRTYDDMMEPDQSRNDTSHAKIQRITPISKFSSLTVWSPDIPVDEGRDEYIRSLTEWTRLAAEIHALGA